MVHDGRFQCPLIYFALFDRLFVCFFAYLFPCVFLFWLVGCLFCFGSVFCIYSDWLCSLFNVEVGIVVVFLFCYCGSCWCLWLFGLGLRSKASFALLVPLVQPWYSMSGCCFFQPAGGSPNKGPNKPAISLPPWIAPRC